MCIVLCLSSGGTMIYDIIFLFIIAGGILGLAGLMYILLEMLD